MRVNACVWMRACVCASVRDEDCIKKAGRVSMHMRVYVRDCVCVLVCVCVCVSVYVDMCACTRDHVCALECVYACECVRVYA